VTVNRSAAGDALTLDHLQWAVERLRRENAPTFDGRRYVAYVSPLQASDIQFMSLEFDLHASYRLSLHARAYFEDDRRRYLARSGSPLPSAYLAFRRAVQLEPPEARDEYARRCPLLVPLARWVSLTRLTP